MELPCVLIQLCLWQVALVNWAAMLSFTQRFGLICEAFIWRSALNALDFCHHNLKLTFALRQAAKI